jgi:PadR family transcriptional regulator PadR
MSESSGMVPSDIIQGTLDMLILRTLERGPMHGLGISDRIKQITGGVFVVKPGSLFPALQRLSENGWITGEWGESENNRRARFYTLARSGRAQLAKEKRNWRKAFSAVNRLLEAES